jgi:hypothetical protein
MLKQLMDEPGWVGIAALAGLLHMDREFAAEFEGNAKSIMININKNKCVAFQGIRQKIDPAAPSRKGTYSHLGKSNACRFPAKTGRPAGPDWHRDGDFGSAAEQDGAAWRWAHPSFAF